MVEIVYFTTISTIQPSQPSNHLNFTERLNISTNQLFQHPQLLPDFGESSYRLFQVFRLVGGG